MRKAQFCEPELPKFIAIAASLEQRKETPNLKTITFGLAHCGHKFCRTANRISALQDACVLISSLLMFCMSQNTSALDTMSSSSLRLDVLFHLSKFEHLRPEGGVVQHISLESGCQWFGSCPDCQCEHLVYECGHSSILLKPSFPSPSRV